MSGNGAGQADQTAEGALAADFLATIGSRIRALRTERSLTVQQLADRADISRRLLTQIEHGQANPSLVTVTRLARQLGTEFTALLAEPSERAAIEVHGPDDQTRVWSNGHASAADLLVATTRRSADLWRWRLEPGDSYRGRPDPEHSEELFHVLEGELTLLADEQEVTVRAGDSARLLSDRDYTYANHGDADTVFVRVVALATDAP